MSHEDLARLEHLAAALLDGGDPNTLLLLWQYHGVSVTLMGQGRGRRDWDCWVDGIGGTLGYASAELPRQAIREATHQAVQRLRAARAGQEEAHA